MESHDIARLGKEVSDAKIMNIVNRMGSFKAPGPNGFQAIFFQNQWQVIGRDFCDMIKMFDDPSKIKDINGSLITLIPKKDVVVCMKDFRPINLCNVSYKVITKIIAQRIRGFMGKLIGPCQSSFVPQCQSGDNIM